MGCSTPDRRDERQREQSVALRTGLHDALELSHDGVGESSLVALDDVLAGLAVRLHWTGDGVVAVPAEDGVAGALARIGLAAHETRASEVWWRLKICAFDECEWAYYDLSKNRSRHYCEYGCGNKLEDPRLPRPPTGRHLKRPLSRLSDLSLSRSYRLVALST